MRQVILIDVVPANGGSMWNCGGPPDRQERPPHPSVPHRRQSCRPGQHLQLAEADLRLHRVDLDQHRWQIGARVLDLGCGYGAYVPHLKARGAEVIAVDLSMGMLAEARAKGAPLVCADAQSLALVSGALDRGRRSPHALSRA